LKLTVIHIAEEQLLFGHEGLRLLDLAKCRVLMFKQQLFFRYVDDRELQMYRLALNILGQKLGSQADAIAEFALVFKTRYLALLTSRGVTLHVCLHVEERVWIKSSSLNPSCPNNSCSSAMWMTVSFKCIAWR
jgi:hypothetical protein